MKLTGAEILTEVLIEQGVTDVFGYPGGQIINVYDALYKYRDKINHVLTAHEQGAAHAADGYSRATGKVGVCIATSGTSTTYNAQGKGTPNVSQYPTPPTAVPQYQRPQYQKPQYHTPPPAMQQNKRSGLVLAILSIIFSVFNGLCLVGLAFGIVGIVNGKRNGDKATYVCGIVGTVLCALAVLSTGYYGYHLL